MSLEFPAMLYKPGSMFQWDGEMFDYLVVETQKEADAALADGWHIGKPPRVEAAPADADEIPKPRRGRPPKEAAE